MGKMNLVKVKTTTTKTAAVSVQQHLGQKDHKIIAQSYKCSPTTTWKRDEATHHQFKQSFRFLSFFLMLLSKNLHSFIHPNI